MLVMAKLAMASGMPMRASDEDACHVGQRSKRCYEQMLTMVARGTFHVPVGEVRHVHAEALVGDRGGEQKRQPFALIARTWARKTAEYSI